MKTPIVEPRNETAGDVLPQIEKLITRAASLEWTRFGKVARELESLLDRLRRTPELAVRLPVPFFSETDVAPGDGCNDAALIMRPSRVEHVVLAPECEDFYWQLFIGCDLQGVDCKPFPARPFLARGDDDTRISAVMAWTSQRLIEPGIRLHMSATNRGKKRARFEALVWVRVVGV